MAMNTDHEVLIMQSSPFFCHAVSRTLQLFLTLNSATNFQCKFLLTVLQNISIVEAYTKLADRHDTGE